MAAERAPVARHLGREVAGHVEATVAEDHGDLRVAADEAEAAPPLALDRLEDEPRLVADEPQERGRRRRQVGQQLAPHRNDAVPRRQRVEVVPTRVRGQGFGGSR